MDVAGRVAIVSGASSGIGESIAVSLARKGAKVVAIARREDRLAQTVDRCRKHVPDSVAMTCDVADRKACERVVADAAGTFGSVDVVVNNAGISMRRVGQDTTVEDVERVMQINFLGAVYLSLAALPGMIARGSGAIINITSVAGYVPTPHESAYGASKAALSHWTHVMNVDLHGTGVHMGVVSPGPIDTEIWDKDEEASSYDGKLYPPEVVADAVIESIHKNIAHQTAPRTYGIPSAMYPIFGKAMRYGVRKFEQRGADKRSRPQNRDS